ncbi:hypothetical protein DPX16_5755 [Anabarilius grahami]|uniref:Uncharacterized protein n=1 Tax=Anabarilius grahami TaxID=495550 RepID=A0A3N0Z9Y1_ANAGA|nr:hypothetical protein DPX16_5755 [Anabarilius grahami]
MEGGISEGVEFVEGMDEYWEDIFGVKATKMPEGNIASTVVKWGLLSPIKAEDVTVALKSMCNSAVGTDKLSAKDPLSWDQASFAVLYNLMLATESDVL